MTRARTDWPGVCFGLGLSFFGAYQLFKLPIVQPLLLDLYGYDRTLAGGFTSVYAFAGLLLSIVLGKLMQSEGPRRLVLGGLLIMVAGNVLSLAAIADGWLVLAGRALEGAAFAVFAIAGPTLANQSASPKTLPFIFGATAAWIPVGQICATLLAQPALAANTWQALWWIGIALSLGFAAWALALKERLRAQQPAGASAQTPQEISPAEWLSLTLAAVMFLVFSGQYFAYMTWMPQYLIEVYGFSLEDAVWAYLLPVFMLLPMNILAGWLIQRGWSLGFMLTGSLAIQALCWWLLPVTSAGIGGIISAVAYGLMAGLTPTCLFAMPSKLLGQGRQAAKAFGIMMTGRNIGVLAGPVAMAQLFQLSGGWDLAAPAVGGFTTVSLVIAVWLWRRMQAAS